MQTRNLLIDENIEILKQGLELLYGLAHDAYPNVKHPFSKYGIGSHFRHCFDFYHSFLSGVEDGRIDYDDRDRDERIERDRMTAISRLEAIIDRLEELSELDNQIPVLTREVGEIEGLDWGQPPELRWRLDLPATRVNTVMASSDELQASRAPRSPALGDPAHF